MKPKILKIDKGLMPYEQDIALRMELFEKKLAQLGDLRDFANGHQYFGFHKTDSGWFYREWAPGADALYLTGDFNNWEKIPLKKLPNGVFELFLEGKDALKDGQQVQTVVISGGRELPRIPLYAKRVIQNPDHSWNAVIYDAPEFNWTDEKFKPKKKLFIYECHIGMAQEEGKVGTYREFTQNVLPRIKKLG